MYETTTKTKLKDKKISIWELLEDGVNENGFPIEGGYNKIHPGKIWAHYRQSDAHEYYRAMSYQYVEDAYFTINYRKGIGTRTFFILYNHKVYKINRIDDFEGYTRDLRISAESVGDYDPERFPGMTED